VILLRIAG